MSTEVAERQPICFSTRLPDCQEGKMLWKGTPWGLACMGPSRTTSGKLPGHRARTISAAACLHRGINQQHPPVLQSGSRPVSHVPGKAVGATLTLVVRKRGERWTRMSAAELRPAQRASQVAFRPVSCSPNQLLRHAAANARPSSRASPHAKSASVIRTSPGTQRWALL